MYLQDVKKNSVGLAIVKILPMFVARFLIATGLIHYMTSHYKYSGKSLQETLDEMTDNTELKSVLSYCFGDYGESCIYQRD